MKTYHRIKSISGTTWVMKLRPGTNNVPVQTYAYFDVYMVTDLLPDLFRAGMTFPFLGFTNVRYSAMVSGHCMWFEEDRLSQWQCLTQSKKELEQIVLPKHHHNKYHLSYRDPFFPGKKGKLTHEPRRLT